MAIKLKIDIGSKLNVKPKIIICRSQNEYGPKIKRVQH